jgi:hypothetical protein
MTQEEKRIKLAEAAGWIEISDWKAAGINGKHPTEPWVEVIPDYFNDLNAVHELEKSLSDGQYDIFEQELARVAGFICHDEWPVPSGLRKVISATAAQRAEALGLTLNLW